MRVALALDTIVASAKRQPDRPEAARIHVHFADARRHEPKLEPHSRSVPALPGAFDIHHLSLLVGPTDRTPLRKSLCSIRLARAAKRRPPRSAETRTDMSAAATELRSTQPAASMPPVLRQSPSILEIRHARLVSTLRDPPPPG